MARLKRISEEERAAKQKLREMGVSDYELNRLYDANYKARQRAQDVGASPKETLNLSWRQILRGARQAEAQGKSASEYVAGRKNLFSKSYKISQVRKEVIDVIGAGDVNISTGEVAGSWAQEIAAKTVKRATGAELANAQRDAVKELREEGFDFDAEVYHRTRAKYDAVGASSQAEWDTLFAQEVNENKEYADELATKVVEYLNKNLDIDAIDEEQAQIEYEAETLFDLETEKGARQAAKYIRDKKRELFRRYGV